MFADDSGSTTHTRNPHEAQTQPPPPPFSPSTSPADEAEIERMRVRVLHIVERWKDSFPDDFAGDAALTHAVRLFVSAVVPPSRRADLLHDLAKPRVYTTGSWLNWGGMGEWERGGGVASGGN